MAGTNDLARAATAYVACITFAGTYLLTIVLGADGLTAVIRGAVVAGATLLLGGFLLRPAISSILDAIAGHEATKQAAKAQAEAQAEAQASRASTDEGKGAE